MPLGHVPCTIVMMQVGLVTFAECPVDWCRSEEKREPVSDIDTAVADSLKVLDLIRPIREADIYHSKVFTLTARPISIRGIAAITRAIACTVTSP
jgi:hypothetical protein